MTNTEIYKKTLTFSLRRVLFDVLSLVIIIALSTGGFLIAAKVDDDAGVIGLLIGLVLGLVVLLLISRYISYTYKAGQIAMMTRGITEDSLPENVYQEGRKEVKERFATIAIFFAVTGAIKAIFNQLGRGLTRVGEAVGGKTGSNVADVINGVIQVVIAYLSDCCLGWVFYRRDVKPARATCEGAVLFFRHGKTLAKNMGRVAGIGLASLAVIGGAFFGIAWLIFSQMPQNFQILYDAIAEAAEGSLTISPADLMLIAAGIAGVAMWLILHSVFVRPFVLVGVLRNYLKSGMEDIPDEASFAMLDGKSDRFRKLRAQEGV